MFASLASSSLKASMTATVIGASLALLEAAAIAARRLASGMVTGSPAPSSSSTKSSCSNLVKPDSGEKSVMELPLKKQRCQVGQVR